MTLLVCVMCVEEKKRKALAKADIIYRGDSLCIAHYVLVRRSEK